MLLRSCAGTLVLQRNASANNARFKLFALYEPVDRGTASCGTFQESQVDFALRQFDDGYAATRGDATSPVIPGQLTVNDLDPGSCQLAARESGRDGPLLDCSADAGLLR